MKITDMLPSRSVNGYTPSTPSQPKVSAPVDTTRALGNSMSLETNKRASAMQNAMQSLQKFMDETKGSSGSFTLSKIR